MNRLIPRIFEYFLIGVLGLLPVVIIFQIVVYVESLLGGFLLNIYGRYENILWPIVLFVGAIAVVIYVGYLIKQDKAYILYFLENFINRIPVLGSIYRVSQKILKLFHDEDEGGIRDVVFIEYPREGLWVPAYVTNRVGAMLVIYVPTSPNPTSGFTLMVDESSVVHCDMTIEEVSSFVISLGADLAHPEDVADRLSSRKTPASSRQVLPTGKIEA